VFEATKTNKLPQDYSLIVSIFFVGYSVFEVPSNLLLNKFRPSVYLSTIMAIWGACVAAMSTCKTREHFLIGRFFLGCIEAGLFPGALYLLTSWYTKAEIGESQLNLVVNSPLFDLISQASVLHSSTLLEQLPLRWEE
jgi:MFS family permease